MEIDWVAVINKVPEIGLVFIFIWFSLKKDADHRTFISDVTTEWRTKFIDQERSCKEFVATMEIRFTDFLTKQQEQYIRTLSEITKQLEEADNDICENKAVSIENRSMLALHEARAEARTKSMLESMALHEAKSESRSRTGSDSKDGSRSTRAVRRRENGD